MFSILRPPVPAQFQNCWFKIMITSCCISWSSQIFILSFMITMSETKEVRNVNINESSWLILNILIHISIFSFVLIIIGPDCEEQLGIESMVGKGNEDKQKKSCKIFIKSEFHFYCPWFKLSKREREISREREKKNNWNSTITRWYSLL